MQRLDEFRKKKVIDKAVELGLEGRKKDVMWKKQLKLTGIAAVAILGIGFATLMTFPALAQHVPIIGEFFDRNNEAAEWKDSIIKEVLGDRIETDDLAITIETHFAYEWQAYNTTAEEVVNSFINFVSIWHEDCNKNPLIDFEGTRFELEFTRFEWNYDENGELMPESRRDYIWTAVVFAPESDEVLATFSVDGVAGFYLEVIIDGVDQYNFCAVLDDYGSGQDYELELYLEELHAREYITEYITIESEEREMLTD